MPDIALYYPYTHVRDESWLKAAALYLPKLALLAPRDYPFRFSPTAQVLRGVHLLDKYEYLQISG